MSIINDALKKARKTTPSSTYNQIPLVNNIEEINTKKPVYKKHLFKLSIVTVCLISIFTIKAFHSRKKNISAIFPVAHDKASSLQVVSPIPALKEADSKFTLSGILYDKEKPFAIINNQIIEQGNLINGAQLLEINPEYVRLSFKNTEFTLQLKK